MIKQVNHEEIVAIKKDIGRMVINAKKRSVVLGWSGGIDSTVSLFLLAGALDPKSISVIHLPHKTSHFERLGPLLQMLNLPTLQSSSLSITPLVDEYKKQCGILQDNNESRVRLGNIMARIRMTILYDIAKDKDALVCGTENRTEHLLGYFTRFGDGASDFEPIRHLYKTQVLQAAVLLGVPREFVIQSPTAGLWDGQTDEGEFGFSYQEADEVLSGYVDEKKPLKELLKKGFTNAKKIIDRMNANEFKHLTPYTIIR